MRSIRASLGSATPTASLPGLASTASTPSAPARAADTAAEACKSLSGAERAFRTSKGLLLVRPIHVYSEDHVRGHVLLCMLAYCVEWRMRRLAQLLFQEGDPTAARARRDTPVEPARVPDHAPHKTAIRVITRPAKLRSKAFELPGVDPHQTVPITVTGCESRLDS